tara:strand:- start:36211 stop:37392 length:1182 start_codon:yes stop_codon:yes gene_type:complete
MKSGIIPKKIVNKFSSSAYASKMAYILSDLVDSGKFGPGVTMPLFTSKGRWENHHITTVNTEHKGLDCYICISEDSMSKHVKIFFTGTYDHLSIERDFSHSAPGYKAFKKENQTILRKIQESIAGKESVTLEITGHSLGGADANHLLLFLLKDNLKNNGFKNVKKIECSAFNAPGSTARNTQLMEDCLRHNAQSATPIKIIANIGFAYGDIVPMLGTQFFQNICSNWLKINLLKQYGDEYIDEYADEYVEQYGDEYADLLQVTKNFEDTLHILVSSHCIQDSFFMPDKPGKDVSTHYNFKYLSNQNVEETCEIRAELSASSMLLSALASVVSWFIPDGEVKFEEMLVPTLHEDYGQSHGMYFGYPKNQKMPSEDMPATMVDPSVGCKSRIQSF